MHPIARRARCRCQFSTYAAAAIRQRPGRRSQPQPKPAAPVSQPPKTPQTTPLLTLPYKQALKSKSITYKPPSLTTNSPPATSSRFFRRAQFLYSAASLPDHPVNKHISEIVVLGASNVGKSTFLNALLARSGIARVSARPGHTTLMNAYGVGPAPFIPRALLQGGASPTHSLVLVDTPGYGYRSQQGWGDLIVSYLQKRTLLKGAVLLISAEKRLLPDDRWMLRALAEAKIPTLAVLTKADKAKSNWVGKCVELAESVAADMDGIGMQGKIHVTAAGMESPEKLNGAGGVDGVRAAVLDMAGFALQDKITKKAEDVAYRGPVVSFDDINWK